MSLSKLTYNYTCFNEWANQRMVEWLSQLPDEVLYKEIPSSFPSLDYTLQHILRGQKFWLKFILEEDTRNFVWAVRESEVRQILAELLSTSAEMKSRFGLFTESELLAELELNQPWAKNRRSRFDYIIHIVNHGSFHRGQLVTMARSIGVTEGIPNTDYNIFNCN